MKFISILFCKHEWEAVNKVTEGAGVGWTLNIETIFGWEYKCCKCGKEKYEGGFYVPCHRDINPHLYDETGFPIDEQGNRLTDSNLYRHRKFT